MNCTNCGRQNDTDSNFCKYCGDNLKEGTNPALNPHQTIFSNLSQPKSNSELGYVIIALIIVFNVFLWLFWTLVLSSFEDGPGTIYNGIRIMSILLSIAQFIVMFIFTKRQSYRIVIGIIAGIVIIYDLYYLIRTFVETNNF